jgi:hypothetical protein
MFGFSRNVSNSSTGSHMYWVWVRVHDNGRGRLVSIWIDPAPTAFKSRPDESFRIAGQVASGIGFRGAAVILRNGLNVTGQNSHATLWCSAAIGTLAGYGMYGSAITGAVAVIAANVCLRPSGRHSIAEWAPSMRTLPIYFGSPPG